MRGDSGVAGEGRVVGIPKFLACVQYIILRGSFKLQEFGILHYKFVPLCNVTALCTHVLCVGCGYVGVYVVVKSFEGVL